MGSIALFDNIQLQRALPLDTRNVVADVAARNALPAGAVYNGLITYVTDPGELQIYSGATGTNIAGSWGALMGSSDGVTLDQASIVAAITDDPAFRTSIGAGTSNFSGSYTDLSNVPITFIPSAHTHTSSEITDFDAGVDTAIGISSTGNQQHFLAADGSFRAVSISGVTPDLSGVTTNDITEGTGSNANLYYTDARVNANTNVAAGITHRANTSNPHSVTAAQVGANRQISITGTDFTTLTNPNELNVSGSSVSLTPDGGGGVEISINHIPISDDSGNTVADTNTFVNLDQLRFANSTLALETDGGTTRRLLVTPAGGGVPDLTNVDSDDITEGTTNRYYTTARANAKQDTIPLFNRLVHTYELIGNETITIPPLGIVVVPDGPIGPRELLNTSDEARNVTQSGTTVTFATGGQTSNFVGIDAAVATADWELVVPGNYTSSNTGGWVRGSDFARNTTTNTFSIPGFADIPLGTGSEGASTLGALTDVNVSGAAVNSVLKYNGSDWVVGTDNTSSSTSGGAQTGTTFPLAPTQNDNFIYTASASTTFIITPGQTGSTTETSTTLTGSDTNNSATFPNFSLNASGFLRAELTAADINTLYGLVIPGGVITDGATVATTRETRWSLPGFFTDVVVPVGAMINASRTTGTNRVVVQMEFRQGSTTAVAWGTLQSNSNTNGLGLTIDYDTVVAPIAEVSQTITGGSGRYIYDPASSTTLPWRQINNIGSGSGPNGGNQIVHLTNSGQDIPAGGFVISFNGELLRNQSGATITGVTQGTTLTTTGTTPPWQLIQPDGFISGIVESPTGTFTATDDDGTTVSWTEGGTLALNDLTDVNIVGTPANNAVLKYDTTTSRWILGADNTSTSTSTNDRNLVATDAATAITGTTTAVSSSTAGAASITINFPTAGITRGSTITTLANFATPSARDTAITGTVDRIDSATAMRVRYNSIEALDIPSGTSLTFTISATTTATGVFLAGDLIANDDLTVGNDATIGADLIVQDDLRVDDNVTILSLATGTGNGVAAVGVTESGTLTTTGVPGGLNSGTTVTANPTGTATATLAKIGIGPTAIFNTLGVEIATAGGDNNVSISGYGLAKFDNGMVVVNNTQNPFDIVGGPYNSDGDLDSRLNIIDSGNYDADDNPEDGHLRRRDLPAITPFTLSQTVADNDSLDLPAARYRRVTNADGTLALELDFFESNDAAEFYNFIDGQNRPVSPFGTTSLSVGATNIHMVLNGSTLSLVNKTLDASIIDNQGDRSIRIPITALETGLFSGASDVRLVKNVVTHPITSGHTEWQSSDGSITQVITQGNINQTVTNPSLFDDVVIQQVLTTDPRLGTSTISNRVLTRFVQAQGTQADFNGGVVANQTTFSSPVVISDSINGDSDATIFTGGNITSSTGDIIATTGNIRASAQASSSGVNPAGFDTTGDLVANNQSYSWQVTSTGQYDSETTVNVGGLTGVTRVTYTDVLETPSTTWYEFLDVVISSDSDGGTFASNTTQGRSVYSNNINPFATNAITIVAF